jgi:hypothetical protein
MFHNKVSGLARHLRQSAEEVCTLVAKDDASRTRRSSRNSRMLKLLVVLLLLAFATPEMGAIELSRADALRIGKKIWQNECAGTISGLTSWNTGENFASLGIGHFIWYPKGVRGPFEESFPDLISFAARTGAKLPQVALANQSRGCPWSTRAEFLAATDSGEMKELRQFLADSVDLQAQFLVQRLQQALPKMQSAGPAADRWTIEKQFNRVASTPQGCYALVDYVNFKGEGVLDSERYQGQGWGLLQVLQGMTGTERGPRAAQEFAESARRILSQRVKNSPAARNESRWLPGWLKRVHSYAQG